MSETSYFDAAKVDTPPGLVSALAVSDITGVPASGTGLLGAVFVPETRIPNTAAAEEAADATPDALFVATEIAYGAKKSDTTIAEFLGEDAASLTGNGDLEFGPSALTLSGYIFIPQGVHEIRVLSDDGFELHLGGIPFSAFDGIRAVEGTARVAEFEGGLYEVDMLYYDAGGGMVLGLEIDGLPVDQSAFYQRVEDFQNPPSDVPLVPVAEYHPSYFLGEASLETPLGATATAARDVIMGQGADDAIAGLGGDDLILGGYGDDILEGGDGDDVLDGGRGSDVVRGGAGDDILIAGSDAGVQRIGQLAIDRVTRGDPDGEVDQVLQKLAVYADQPITGDDVLIGGAGRDTFLIKPQLNAKLDIIQKHVQADGTINWAGVAGENNELHDHWVDSFGIDIIADYNAAEDHIAVIGHTANPYVTHADVNGDGIEESIITVISVQHGGGGAHDRDLIGQAIVFGDRVELADIDTNANVTYGIVESYADVAEALFPGGEEKTTLAGGQQVKGYDTRQPPSEAMDHGNIIGTDRLGAVTGDPFAAFDNPNFDPGTMIAAPGDAAPAMEPTRAPFEPLGTVAAPAQTIAGSNGADILRPDSPEAPDGLPGALGYWSLGQGTEGAYGNEAAAGIGTIKAYTLSENAALPNPGATTEGPGGPGTQALYFNGEDSFAYLAHDDAMAITQGTIAMWVRPDDLGETSIFVSKDHSGRLEGGHFRLGHTKEGGLLLRMAEGDGGANQAWETGPVLGEGMWQHLAVGFTDTGVTVYLDGAALRDGTWRAVEGDVATPGAYTEGYLLANAEPWVFGADQATTNGNDTAGEFATDRQNLLNEFEGGIAGFGVWGGSSAEDALSQSQIAQLIAEGPGTALTNPAGPQAMMASDDVIDGFGGDDLIEGGAGDDRLYGGAGDDTVLGGYGDDLVSGGAGDDVLDGGWGSDLVMGGDGDDTLRSRADVGEDRAGQLVLDDPSRPAKAIDAKYMKLFDWLDQPLVGDDVLVGGAGRDHFQIETLINGTRESILDNTNDDRSINWMGVAGENKYIHDHWVDGIGIDVIADYDADEDRISVIGHTTNINVRHATIDRDGDGVDDDLVSIIHAYSQQGKGGGAHDEDSLGYIVVFGDKVEEEDVEVNPGAHHGVVDTIDDLQEAFAPTGATKWSQIGGARHLGYDSRDIEGDPIGSDPLAFSGNAWLNAGQVDLARSVDETLAPPGVLVSHEGGMFGAGEAPIEIGNDGTLSPVEGTWAASFVAYAPAGGEDQAILSQDHLGFKDGGHLTAFINSQGVLSVRFQSEQSEVRLADWGTRIEPGEEYHMAFTFAPDAVKLYLNGQLLDSDEGFADGMSGNAEDMMIGASTRLRRDDEDNPSAPFNGEIGQVVLLDRPITDTEAAFLSEAGGDIGALDVLYAPRAEDGPFETGLSELTEPAPMQQGQGADDGPAVEEDAAGASGSGNIFASLINAFINIFLGIFGGGARTDTAASEGVMSALDEFETLLSDLVPVTGPEEDEMPEMTGQADDEDGALIA